VVRPVISVAYAEMINCRFDIGTQVSHGSTSFKICLFQVLFVRSGHRDLLSLFGEKKVQQNLLHLHSLFAVQLYKGIQYALDFLDLTCRTFNRTIQFFKRTKLRTFSHKWLTKFLRKITLFTHLLKAFFFCNKSVRLTV
jgi:hypothetical protein